jgi:hypothetical protein
MVGVCCNYGTVNSVDVWSMVLVDEMVWEAEPKLSGVNSSLLVPEKKTSSIFFLKSRAGDKRLTKGQHELYVRQEG